MYIYGLYNSFSDEIRYIGKTNNIKRRLSEHIQEAKSNKYNHFPKNRWILKTLASNGKINIKILETTDDASWPEREKYWIKYYKNISSNILNISEGGEGFNKNFLSYKECKKWVKNNLNNVKTENEWKSFVKKNILPKTIPHNPSACYENFSWNDFLGNRKKEKLFNCFSVKDLKKIIKREKIYTFKDFSKYFSNYQIPKETTFQKQGFDIKSFFKETWFVDYSVFKRYILIFFPNVISLNTFKKEHKNMSKRIPFYLEKYYGDDFDNFNFLNFKKCGNDTYHTFRNFYSYEKSKKIVSKMGFKNSIDFKKRINTFTELDPQIPHSPDDVYLNKGWKGWEDFLNYESNKRRKKCNLKLFVRYMKIYHKDIQNSKQYKQMFINQNISKNLPKRPDIKYKMKWKDLFKLINEQ